MWWRARILTWGSHIFFILLMLCSEAAQCFGTSFGTPPRSTPSRTGMALATSEPSALSLRPCVGLCPKWTGRVWRIHGARNDHARSGSAHFRAWSIAGKSVYELEAEHHKVGAFKTGVHFKIKFELECVKLLTCSTPGPSKADRDNIMPEAAGACVVT